MSDALTLTARQVRAPRRKRVHIIDATFRTPEHGTCYTTRCGQTFSVAGAAVLTTHPVTCRTCEVRT